MPFRNIEIIRSSAIDQKMLKLIERNNAYTAVMRKDAYFQLEEKHGSIKRSLIFELYVAEKLR